MKIQLKNLSLITKKSIENIKFSDSVTFIYGPISKGKSSVARLIDYCFGGKLERTPAIQNEFISVQLTVLLGSYNCILERGAKEGTTVRVTWSHDDGDIGSINAPLSAQDYPIVEGREIYNLSDLIFSLCGVTPIKVRRSSRDPDSPLIRLGFRDIWRFCYLDQAHLDSSFFQLEDTFKGRKTQDAMRFFTGLYSERLNELDKKLLTKTDEQRTKREAVKQLRKFITRFKLDSGLEIADQLRIEKKSLNQAVVYLSTLEKNRQIKTHPTDSIRNELRSLGRTISEITEAIYDSETTISQQKALKAQLITTKTKAERVDQAERVLEGVSYHCCPQCGADVSMRVKNHDHCGLCGSNDEDQSTSSPVDLEIIRRELNERIDQISDSISLRLNELIRTKRQLTNAQQEKSQLENKFQVLLERYDSAFVEEVRNFESKIATLRERIISLQKLYEMHQEINEQEISAGASQGDIDLLKRLLQEEQARLSAADLNVSAIAKAFLYYMCAVGLPGVTEDDIVDIRPQNWKPVVVHENLEWSFWDAGSGGKKTLFNVCYALAIHYVAVTNNLPVPDLLIIDSPTKNISDDENPELVKSLYKEIYGLANLVDNRKTQFLLIDSDLVEPANELSEFSRIRMAGEKDAPSLIPYYVGP